MASIQARHTRACATGKPWTPFERSKMPGCTCLGGPSYYIVVRDGKKLHRERIGKDRQAAERSLRKIGTAVDEGAYTPQKSIRFSVWAEQWLQSLERESSTVRSYRSTIAFANRAFGERPVRNVGTEDVRRMLVTMRNEGLGDSTRAKHLRVLSACLTSAMAAGYAARNPVRVLPRGEKPRPRRRESAFFQNDELAPLFAKLEPGPYRLAYEVALKTGMRMGELSGLTWVDVDFAGAVIRVRWSYTDGELKAPKNHERRDVDITKDIVETLGFWFGELRSPADKTLVFPGATKSGFMSPDMLRRNLYAAMERAEIPRLGPTGEERTFHSFRHTFAKIVLENGRPMTWLSRHLGHSSTAITDEHYGHFEKAARKREIEALSGAFSV